MAQIETNYRIYSGITFEQELEKKKAAGFNLDRPLARTRVKKVMIKTK